MYTNPPMRTRLTAEEWIEWAWKMPEGQPFAVTIWEWNIIDRLFPHHGRRIGQTMFCGRPIVVVTGEPAWFLTNT